MGSARLRVVAARSSSVWAKHSNPREQCERTPIVFLAESGRTATRLSAILGRMRHAAAQRASSPQRRNRDVLIKDEKQLMECGVGQQG